MQPVDAIYTADMTEQQRAWFYAEYQRASKDEVAGTLFAFFLGSFGIHHFYLRHDGLGIVYLLLFWTGIPALLGFVECFFMPGRVREYNAMQASYLRNQILGNQVLGRSIGSPSAAICPACHSANDHGAFYCIHCGAAMSAGAVTPTVAI